MKCVTRMAYQKKNRERVNIYLDGEFAFGLALDEALQLKIGQQLSEAQIEALRDEDGYHKGYARALDLLSRRPRSQRELERALNQKGVSEPHVERIIARLERAGYVDDGAFARYWIENREAFRPRGAQALRHELRQKGLNETIIAQALQASELDEVAGALEVARKKLPRLHGLENAQQFQQKLAGFLARRGYGWDVIRAVADQLWAEQQGDESES